MKRCPACGLQKPLTAEHVWPRWLRAWPSHASLLNAQSNRPRARFDRFTTRIGPDGRLGAEKVGDQQAILLPHLTVKVCAVCNNGWMAALESEAKPILEAMFADPHRHLSRAEASIAARWVAKTCFTYSLRLTRQEHVMDSRTLQEMVRSSEPPANMQIWVGHSRAPRAQLAMADVTGLMTRAAPTADELVGPANVISTFIGANGIVFIMYYAGPTGPPVELFNRPSVFDGFSLLWPNTSGLRLPRPGLSDTELLVALNHVQAVFNARGFATDGHTVSEVGQNYAYFREQRRRPGRRRLGRLLVPPMSYIFCRVLRLSRWVESRKRDR